MSATLTPSAAGAVRRPRRSLRFARDEELVRLLRAGDESAFETLFDRHHRGVLAFARHMVGSREEAEDVVQHTFLAAHRDLVGSTKPIQLKAWLYTIARNRCLSLLRAKREERALEDVPEPSVEGLASQVQRRQDLRDMVADLQRLPEEQRAALVLSELGALSHEEVAETLGVRKDKVKALVFQARESLASSRTAREADCQEIQEQLAVLRGGSLRRTTLRRHVEVCPACAAFKAEVNRQRKALAVILPVAPTLALKEAVLGAAVAAGGGGAAFLGGGGAAAGGGLLAAAGAGSKSLAAKVMAIAAVAGGATGGGIMAVDEISSPPGDVAMGDSVPSERRAVQLVGDLRARAQRAAVSREAERRSAGASGSGAETRPASGTTPGEGRRARVFASAGTARAVALAGKPRRTRQERRRAAAPRRVVATPRDPVVAQAPPPPPALPATEVGPETDGGRTEKGGPKPDRGWRKRAGDADQQRTAQAELPKVEVPATLPADRAKTKSKSRSAKGDDDDGDDRRAAGVQAQEQTPPVPRGPKQDRPRGPKPGKKPHGGKPSAGPPQGQGGQQQGQGGPARETMSAAGRTVKDAVSKVLGVFLAGR